MRKLGCLAAGIVLLFRCAVIALVAAFLIPSGTAAK
jgi:hypothetical protein